MLIANVKNARQENWYILMCAKMEHSDNIYYACTKLEILKNFHFFKIKIVLETINCISYFINFNQTDGVKTNCKQQHLS